MYFAEHRQSLKRTGKLELVPVEALPTYTGFRGVYEFSAHVVPVLEKQGHTRDLQDIPVHSDTLFLDFDECPEKAEQFKQWLLTNDHSFEEFHSGNRSIHFHVPIVPMVGIYVPQTQKMWVKMNVPGADTSFYHKSGLYRLTGTYHVKNPGHCKRRLYSHTGTMLHIRADRAVAAAMYDISDDGEAGNILHHLLNREIQEGDRTPHMYKILKTASRVGYDFDDALDEVLWWNENKCLDPHPEEYIIQWAQRTWR